MRRVAVPSVATVERNRSLVEIYPARIMGWRKNLIKMCDRSWWDYVERNGRKGRSVVCRNR
jgi:hypothetical protein